ncbi:hypothetical protein [Roseobacter sp. MH60115]|uniref:hypothetical protein n=1 Tax=Roseobacter sp. MH60115 TaxID=2785324 RepID=UPI001E59798D|nr:hypothetical protein [Roseobacter sp. MH60115]
MRHGRGCTAALWPLALMPRWLWFTPLALLVVAVAIWAFRLGWIAVTISETDVINTYAQRYLEEAGATARLTDCTGLPGTGEGVWIIVRCVRAGQRFDYPVDRFGRLLDLVDGVPQPGVPQT